jgi:hypothetical protein
MFQINDKVLVIDESPAEEGVVEKISTWGEVLNIPSDKSFCYFVRVLAWDKGQNGGRWLATGSIERI